MTPWVDRPRGVIYDATDNEVRRAAAQQRAMADALAPLAGVEADVIELLHATRPRRRKR
jgi:hypothetical protein